MSVGLYDLPWYDNWLTTEPVEDDDTVAREEAAIERADARAEEEAVR